MSFLRLFAPSCNDNLLFLPFVIISPDFFEGFGNESPRCVFCTGYLVVFFSFLFFFFLLFSLSFSALATCPLEMERRSVSFAVLSMDLSHAYDMIYHLRVSSGESMLCSEFSTVIIVFHFWCAFLAILFLIFFFLFWPRARIIIFLACCRGLVWYVFFSQSIPPFHHHIVLSCQLPPSPSSM